MKLTCMFFDASGTSLASPVKVEDADEALAYQTARAFRDAVQAKRGVRVLMQTVEEP